MTDAETDPFIRDRIEDEGGTAAAAPPVTRTARGSSSSTWWVTSATQHVTEVRGVTHGERD